MLSNQLNYFPIMTNASIILEKLMQSVMMSVYLKLRGKSNVFTDCNQYPNNLLLIKLIALSNKINALNCFASPNL